MTPIKEPLWGRDRTTRSVPSQSVGPAAVTPRAPTRPEQPSGYSSGAYFGRWWRITPPESSGKQKVRPFEKKHMRVAQDLDSQTAEWFTGEVRPAAFPRCRWHLLFQDFVGSNRYRRPHRVERLLSGAAWPRHRKPGCGIPCFGRAGAGHRAPPGVELCQDLDGLCSRLRAGAEQVASADRPRDRRLRAAQRFLPREPAAELGRSAKRDGLGGAMTPAQKAAVTRKRRTAAAKAVQTKKRRAAGAKAALTRKRKAAARKAAETRKRKAATKQLASPDEQPASPLQ